MSKVLVLGVIGLTCATLGASPPDTLSRYRDVTLGDSVQTVVDRLQVPATDVKVLYQLPSLVQEITWRPHRFISGSTVTPDPLGELVLTFHKDRLARIVAIYDRERTAGLTDADLHELLSTVYGTAILRSTTPQAAAGSPSIGARRSTVSSWADASTLLVLWREDYPSRLGLTITSPTGEAALQDAVALGTRLAADGAPERETVRIAAAAAAIKDRDAQIRIENKAKFKP